MGVFEDSVPRRVFGTKMEKVTGWWRNLHNEDVIICTLHSVLIGR